MAKVKNVIGTLRGIECQVSSEGWMVRGAGCRLYGGGCAVVQDAENRTVRLTANPQSNC